jgi:hypothetical protein
VSALTRVAIGLAVVGGAPLDARGEDRESAAAALFAKARALVEAGDHAAACPMFEVSLELEPALGTELNLAQCWAQTGRLVDALALYERLIEKTQGAGQEARLAIARDGATALSTRVARVRVELVRLVGATVTVDGRPIDDTEPVVLDPGEHTAEAVDVAKRTVRATFRVAEGETVSVQLIAPPDPTPRHPRRRLIIGLAAGGGATILAGAFTGVAYLGKRSAGLGGCRSTADGLQCDARSVATLDSARTLSYVTTVLMVAGVGLVGASAGIYYRRRPQSRTTTALVPVIAPDLVGVSLEARW